MNMLMLALLVYFVLLVTVLALQRLFQGRARSARARGDQDSDPTGSGYAPSGAWDELDTYIARSHGGHPLQ